MRITAKRPLSDAEADMALVTDNTQSKLKPLEIGLHALRVVGKGEDGRGKNGGYTAYAKAIGKTQPFVSQMASAARVYEAVKTHKTSYGFSDYHNHLAEIAKAFEAL